MRISGIYKIINKVNGKYYVGSSEDIETPNVGRWYNHKYMLKKGIHHNKHLQRAWNKYGEENFDFLISELCPPIKLIEIEQKYLDEAKKNPETVYNSTFIAGKIEMTAETRKKISDKAKERLKNPENHPLFGKHHSEETKSLIAQNSPRYGPENGMWGVSRRGKDAPGYGKGQKIKGSLNPRYNHTIYKFVNVETKEIFIGTKFDFCQKFNLKSSVPNDLLRKWIKKNKDGWTVMT